MRFWDCSALSGRSPASSDALEGRRGDALGPSGARQSLGSKKALAELRLLQFGNGSDRDDGIAGQDKSERSKGGHHERHERAIALSWPPASSRSGRSRTRGRASWALAGDVRRSGRGRGKKSGQQLGDAWGSPWCSAWSCSICLGLIPPPAPLPFYGAFQRTRSLGVLPRKWRFPELPGVRQRLGLHPRHWIRMILTAIIHGTGVGRSTRDHSPFVLA